MQHILSTHPSAGKFHVDIHMSAAVCPAADMPTPVHTYYGLCGATALMAVALTTQAELRLFAVCSSDITVLREWTENLPLVRLAILCRSPVTRELIRNDRSNDGMVPEIVELVNEAVNRSEYGFTDCEMKEVWQPYSAECIRGSKSLEATAYTIANGHTLFNYNTVDGGKEQLLLLGSQIILT